MSSCAGFGRAALVGIGSLFVAAWVVVPLLADRLWTVNDEYSRAGKICYDSFGAKKILMWFASGELVRPRAAADDHDPRSRSASCVALWRKYRP